MPVRSGFYLLVSGEEWRKWFVGMEKLFCENGEAGLWEWRNCSVRMVKSFCVDIEAAL